MLSLLHQTPSEKTKQNSQVHRTLMASWRCNQ